MSAIISPCGLYRYRLERDVQMAGIVVALFGVNPSTADATVNDATIRKDIGFAKVHGWRKIIKGNVFPFRATKVFELATCSNPLGTDNETYLRAIADEADLLVPCWGNQSKVPKALRHHFDRTLEILSKTGRPLMHFGLTDSGDPKHPLFLPYDTPLTNWNLK